MSRRRRVLQAVLQSTAYHTPAPPPKPPPPPPPPPHCTATAPKLLACGMSERRPSGAICVVKKIVCRGATAVSCRCTASRLSGPAAHAHAHTKAQHWTVGT